MTIIAGVLIAHLEYFNHDNRNINSLNRIKNNNNANNNNKYHSQSDLHNNNNEDYE